MKSMNVNAVIGKTQQIRPIRKGNEAKTITKNGDGSLSVEFGNGTRGVLHNEDMDMQAFVVWTMLHQDARA